MSDVVIVEAVRSPLGRRKGGLSGTHSIELLAALQRALFARSGVDPASVGQVVGGCVGQVGMQAMNVTRQAWLTAGLPLEVAASFPIIGWLTVVPLYIITAVGAIVLPGPDTIRLDANQQLKHTMRVYVNYLQAQGATTLPERARLTGVPGATVWVTFSAIAPGIARSSSSTLLAVELSISWLAGLTVARSV